MAESRIKTAKNASALEQAAAAMAADYAPLSADAGAGNSAASAGNVEGASAGAELASAGTQTPAKKQRKLSTVSDYLASPTFAEQFAKALPKHLDTEHFMRSALSEFRINQALQECSVPSVLGYFMQAAMLGLEPASVLGQCYSVPFTNRKTGAREAQFILGYRGMMSIARRSGDLARIEAHIVHERDAFTLTYGLTPNIEHTPYIDGDPGAVRGAYCVIWFKDGQCQYHYMPKFEIDKHRARSKSGNYGPWVTDYEEMCLKTVFRAMFKWLPVSIELMQDISRDETVAKYKGASASPASASDNGGDDFIEVDFTVATPE